jgi:hypothetical protein
MAPSFGEGSDQVEIGRVVKFRAVGQRWRGSECPVVVWAWRLLSHAAVVDVASGRACCRLAPFHRGSVRRVRRYPSDTTDAQWALLDRLLPERPCYTGKLRHRRSICDRKKETHGVLSVADAEQPHT